ncbi:MAG: hypothetical protein IRY95_09665, partial [Clostridia bacterium]|nr:hypothetical protein [Clostridia bacterium]
MSLWRFGAVPWPVAVAATLGTASAGTMVDAVGTAVFSVLVGLGARWPDGRTAAMRAWAAASLSQGLLVVLRQPSVLETLQVGFHGVAVTILTLMGFLARDVVRGRSDPNRFEDAGVAFVLLAGAGVAGLGGLGWGLVEPQVAVAGAAVLLAAWYAGPAAGATTAVALAAVGFLMGATPPWTLAVLAVAGTLAGAFRAWGPWGIVFGFSMGITLGGFAQHPLPPVPFFGGAALGTAIFPLLERRLSTIVTPLTAWPPVLSRASVAHRSQLRVRAVGRALQGMARLLEDAAPAAEEAGLQPLVAIVDSVSRGACQGCTLLRECWERRYLDTYRDVVAIVSHPPAVGREPELLRRCVRPERLLAASGHARSLLRLQASWQRRWTSLCGLVARQLGAMGSALANETG